MAVYIILYTYTNITNAVYHILASLKIRCQNTRSSAAKCRSDKILYYCVDCKCICWFSKRKHTRLQAQVQNFPLPANSPGCLLDPPSPIFTEQHHLFAAGKTAGDLRLSRISSSAKVNIECSSTSTSPNAFIP